MVWCQGDGPGYDAALKLAARWRAAVEVAPEGRDWAEVVGEDWAEDIAERIVTDG